MVEAKKWSEMEGERGRSASLAVIYDVQEVRLLELMQQNC